MELSLLGVAVFVGVLLIGLSVVVCSIGMAIYAIRALIKYVKLECIEYRK